MAALKRITSIEELTEAMEDSVHGPLLLFKHSTRCPISSGAHREVEAYLSQSPNEAVTYGVIYVVEDRGVSNAAAERLGVKHESPQAILVKNEQAVWHTSHSDITSEALEGILAE
ncbi:bacillithiol system redox-active protein YtxJ [Paenibacillus bouchesdurhonensis]|uniref:bacillithiol system redox-active protein YtxJ n=1 Tax=Paenibacillus bouchesdurhonensis TaxID=1870990 RepID=UPI000DA602D5|nr:bacillithiol system redox-active protein YtxJ [Paenibacillus bouchesdurhonensis]